MTTPAPSRAHLERHRRMIILRSLAAGAAGFLPVPLLDDYVVGVLRRGTLARIAEAWQVDIEPAALDHLADAPPPPPGGLKGLLRSVALPVLLRRGFKKAFLLLGAARRADATLRSFAAATLFDHYCARLHLGAAVDLAQAERLRVAIDGTLQKSRGRVAATLFRRGLAATGRALMRVPTFAIEQAARSIRSKLAATPLEAEKVTEDTLEAAAAPGGRLAAITRAVEQGMGTLGAAYLDEIVAGLEQRLKDA